jgi:fructose-bisphosphate aldolase class I
MNRPMLVQTAQALVGNGRGLLAMDESNGTCNKRFAAAVSRKPRMPGAPTAS